MVLTSETSGASQFKFWVNVKREKIFEEWLVEGIPDNTTGVITIVLEVDGDAFKRSLSGLNDAKSVGIRLTKKLGGVTAILNVSIDSACLSNRSRDISHDIPCYVLSRQRWDEFRFDDHNFKPHVRVKIASARQLAHVVDKFKDISKMARLRILKKPRNQLMLNANQAAGHVSASQVMEEGLFEIIGRSHGNEVITTFEGLTLVNTDLAPMIPNTETGDENANRSEHRGYGRSHGYYSSLMSSDTTNTGIVSVTVDAKQFSTFLHSFGGTNSNVTIGIREDHFAIFKIMHPAFTVDFILSNYNADLD